METIEVRKEILMLQKIMFHFALMLTSNKDDANDLVQETTLKALNNAQKYTNNLNFKGWVLTIMRNTFINNYRKVVRNQTIINEKEKSISMFHDYDTNLIEENIGAQEIKAAINALPNDLRITFSMHIAGYKYHEIADELKLPIGTVKSRIHFARQKLQQQLREMA